MKESKRQLKFSRFLQKDLGDIFQRQGRSFFGNTMITVTQVRMSPDLSIARVYLSFLLAPDSQALMEQIIHRKSEIRKILGQKIGNQVRVVPDLHFFHDDSSAYASKIESILAGLDIPKEKDQEDES